MVITLFVLFLMLSGEPIPWYVPCITGGLAIAFHCLMLACIAWTHTPQRKGKST